jgi:hypothetical protein
MIDMNVLSSTWLTTTIDALSKVVNYIDHIFAALPTSGAIVAAGGVISRPTVRTGRDCCRRWRDIAPDLPHRARLLPPVA